MRGKARDDIEEKLEKLFNQDFNERLIDDKPEKSKEDLLFTKKVENSIRVVDGHFEIALPLRHDAK